ncbi:hypothetical protein QAD02_018483 [Eretmocerus hayati]|uniref:Uncharacterized protein n=1 Tax=Eretmocerus hayati TaxID=131215 RepID=A0ACC2PIN8_9HYME|nr:hypothetical protein QAD02_018483 [Eretmocerus hayati]
MWKIVLLFWISSSTADPNYESSLATTKIDPGKPLDVQGHPYYVSIEAGVPYSCGGAIISAHWVLTSVKCAQIPNAIVRAGTNFWNRNGTEHHVKRIIIHERFNITRHKIPVNDIALMEVVEHFNFDRFHQPVVPAHENSTIQPHSQAHLSGMATLINHTDTILVLAGVSTIETEICNQAYQKALKHFKGLAGGKFCTSYSKNTKVGPCNDDWGSPLVDGDQLIGILTWHNKKCKDNIAPAIFTKVADYYKWINARVDFTDWKAYLKN